jgi:hypothetical protein
LIVFEDFSLNNFSMSFCICTLRFWKIMCDVIKDVLETTSRRFDDVDIIDTRSQ